MKWLKTIVRILLNLEHMAGQLFSQHKIALNYQTAPPQPLEKMMNRQEVIRYLKISPRTYTRLRNKGVLKGRQIGKKVYYTKEDLDAATKESIRKGRW